MDGKIIYLKETLIKELIEQCGVLKYGEYVLKSGEKSNYYFDLKGLVSYPASTYKIMSNISYSLLETLEKKEGKKIDRNSYILCGVPTGGVFFASVLSVISGIPMIMIRDKKKIYGTQKQIEGNYQDKKLIIVEDVVTTGTSIKEYLEIIFNHNIKVSSIISILDREKGGFLNIETFFKEKKIMHPDCSSYFKVSEFLEHNKQTTNNNFSVLPKPKLDSLLCKNIWTNKLRKAIKMKSNLCLSLDIPYWDRFFEVLEKTANKICMLKIHLDIMKNTEPQHIKRLKNMAVSNNFLIWEDRKFCDIGNTNKLQLDNLLDLELVDFVSVNPSGGLKSLEPFFDRIGVFVLAEMSSENNLLNRQYTAECLEITNKNHTKISGIINQTIKKDYISSNLLSITPGISIEEKSDNTGQKYRKLYELENKPDIIVVGRAIYNSKNPEETINHFI